MANVLLTTYCNRNCAYCFGRERIDLARERGDDTMNLGMESLEEIIAFHLRSQLQRFVVLGGEPTLHPDFAGMIERIRQERAFESIVIFTNGLMPGGALDYLAGLDDPRIGLALNLNAPSEYTDREWRSVNGTMSRLGGMVGLGINIFRKGQEYDYIIESVCEHGLSKHVRLGLAQPIPGLRNVYAREEELPDIASDIMAFGAKAVRRGLTFSFDCGFRFCMFTLDRHRTFLEWGIDFKARCSPIIDIAPDLSVGRCFPLIAESPARLSDFRTRNDAIRHYNELYRAYVPMGNKPECADCRYRVGGMCSGGCLARTLASFRTGGKREVGGREE